MSLGARLEGDEIAGRVDAAARVVVPVVLVPLIGLLLGREPGVAGFEHVGGLADDGERVPGGRRLPEEAGSRSGQSETTSINGPRAAPQRGVAALAGARQMHTSEPSMVTLPLA